MKYLPRIDRIIFILFLTFSTGTFSQSNNGIQDVKYRRSSLHRILIESDKFPLKDTVITAYYNAPFPEKYNNHSIDSKPLNPKRYALSNTERADLGLKEKREKKVPDSLFNGKVSNPEMPYIIQKYFKKNKVANKLVAKWFNRQEDGAFNMGLIAERGFYDASELEYSIANATVRGEAGIADAGEELLNNTFVVVSKMNYVSNEVMAAGIYAAALIAADELGGIGRIVARKAAKILYNKSREGYTVWTTSYLYKLKWNDSIANTFYQKLWVDSDNLNQNKINLFDKSELFELEFVGEEKARTLVTFSLKKGEGNRTEEQIVQRATVRNVNRNYVKLQKAYEVFKTKIPLYTGGENITAKIGMKEGIKGGDKFEVLEQVVNPKTGKTEYKVKGVIKVDKKAIWDNRYYGESTVKTENPKVTITGFKGGKKYYAGMLIRQVK